ncbi:hypothetical protein H257_10640 [Aphanomyces astaci]|uniref:Reverse transcriptase/retrotransposon-derived protein RNase H-like domain-containing protein n=1 Tax=Aphanomyces astaci TaxID=112090 RepID=W4G7Y3_APHAT|nr:hypothetical protein H257_10640 [Aphanomyces astaci]ETV75043.1 hypothetical protein H257_10640 [Aphanomyces astaci]|eukprot:XP_009835547.1 hypothetical protein H257_10640 [Aphanomyces astaci]
MKDFGSGSQSSSSRPPPPYSSTKYLPLVQPTFTTTPNPRTPLQALAQSNPNNRLQFLAVPEPAVANLVRAVSVGMQDQSTFTTNTPTNWTANGDTSLPWTRYYRKFILDLTELIRPLSGLLKKGAKWHWSEDKRRAFLTIKFALQQTPVFQLPDYNKPFVVTTDVSGFCCGTVTYKLDGDGNDRSVAYMSKQTLLSS